MLDSDSDFELDEALDELDPLRHLMNSDTDDLDVFLVPKQLPSILNDAVQLSFKNPADQNEIYIDLVVDASPGCGGIAWPAGGVLASYLVERGSQSIQGKTFIELGSGTGLVGLVAAKLGGKVWITDQAPLLEIMHKNVFINNLSASVNILELNWGECIPDNIPRADVILAADCVYFEPAFPLLVQTLSELASDEKTEILFCYKKRRKADKRFFSLLRKIFTWSEILDHSNREIYSRQAISLLRLTRKR